MLTPSIAIIGMAGRFPDAHDVEQFYGNLRAGRDSLRGISKDRIAATTLDPDARYRAMGYLEDVDRFDAAFFGISVGEALTLHPAARLLLQELWRTFESAACPPDRFRGSRTDVYMTPVDGSYAQLAETASATLFTGNSPDFVAARLNRQFDFRGNSVVVDTSCSSGLAAVLMACDGLQAGRCEYAVVCGVNLDLVPEQGPSLLETWSPDAKSRSFAADANGMAPGEAVVCLLLTTLTTAEHRQHPIQAVIRGGALNNNGAASSSPSAPNSVMQAQAIREAWERAGIDPRDLGFIEGHGSATQLGDSLEIEALRQAFGDRMSGSPPCALSSVKANIGHAKAAAGLTSLVKAVLSVQRGVLFPAPYAEHANPLLRKPDSPVYANTDVIPWRQGTRVAGVHSIGMTGVNCHVVVESYPSPLPPVDVGVREWYPIPVSARDGVSLADNVAALRDWVARRQELNVPDVAHALGLGRQQLQSRRLVMARDRDELIRAWSAELPPSPPHRGDRRPPRVVMLLSADRDEAAVVRAMGRALAERFPRVRETLARLDPHGASDDAFTVALQLALHELLTTLGISGAVIGVGAGRLAAATLGGQMTADQAMCGAEAAANEAVTDLEARVSRLISTQVSRGPVAFLQLGPDSMLSREVRRALDPADGRVEAFDGDAPVSLGEIAGRLFVDGLPLQFGPWFERRETRPAPLPGYRFARTRCWIRESPRPPAALRYPAREQAPDPQAAWTGASFLERKIGEVCRALLGEVRFGPHDNLFDVGADSLLATRIVRHVNDALGLRCDFEDIFDSPTVAGFAAVVKSQCSVRSLITLMWKDVLKLDAIADGADFFDLGGHSLLASEILIHVRREFAVALSFEDFFAAPAPAAFAALVERRLDQGAPPGPPAAEPDRAADAAPLTADVWAATLRRRELS